MSAPELPRWIGLAGPTASGKTAVALALAERWPLEVVSVDSALVYRSMDVGTAKPSAEERARVPHHLIDLLDPLQSYSAAQFVADARRLIGEIRSRGRLPLLVGGTMLYFKALIDGLDALPAADAALRAEIDAEAAAVGWPEMHARLARVDPATAARLPPNDTQRLQRAIEVWRLTGRPLSTFHTRSSGRPSAAPQADHLLISLEPEDRAWLHRRINERFEAMWQGGLLAEVQALRARGDLDARWPSMRCVGYRQAWEALDASLTGTALREQVLERGAAATRQLAKRQITWLRSMARSVVAADGRSPGEGVARQVALAWGP